jgi:hypothetical protein
MAQAILFEEIFDIRALNENGGKFERGKNGHIRDRDAAFLTT